MAFKNEWILIQNSYQTLLFKKGLTKATFGWLTLMGNIGVINQCLKISFGVVVGAEGVADLFLWYALLLSLVFVTPKVLNMDKSAEQFYIKFYIVIFNSVYTAIFLFTLYAVMISKGYLLDVDFSFYDPGEDFYYINSLISIQIFLWLIALYLNRLLPLNYLNYASAPIFILVFVSIILMVFFASYISIYSYFKISAVDGSARLCISFISFFLFVVIIKKTVFVALVISKNQT